MHRKQSPAPAKSAPAPAKPAKKPAEKKPEVKLDVEAAFDALDKDGVGFMVLEKLRPSLRRKGYTPRFVEHLFCHLGPDLRGRVTRAHFQDALKCLPKGIFACARLLLCRKALREATCSQRHAMAICTD